MGRTRAISAQADTAPRLKKRQRGSRRAEAALVSTLAAGDHWREGRSRCVRAACGDVRAAKARKPPEPDPSKTATHRGKRMLKARYLRERILRALLESEISVAFAEFSCVRNQRCL